MSNLENNLDTTAKKPLIIFDTDMDTDCDDAGALALIYDYVQRGRAELLGIITDVPQAYAAPCCEALGIYYGIRRPIGAIPADAYPPEETDRFVNYRRHSENIGILRYNDSIAAAVGKKDTDYPAAVQMYRQLLSQAPDESVTVVCVGVLTALTETLLSPTDEISPLSGEELIRKKVLRVISMGYPDPSPDNFNWEMDGEGANIFLERCPVPVYVSGAGSTVITGNSLSRRLPEEHPLRRIYEIFNMGPNKGRCSWDLVAALYGVDPDTPLLRIEGRGSCRFDNIANRSYWLQDHPRKDYEILPAVSDEELAAYLEEHMTGGHS